jgi:hypothetical protein
MQEATEKVNGVSKAGIYRIVLPPAFVARCRADLSDLRVLDQDDKEAPYVLKADRSDRLNAGFLPLPDPKILQQDSSDRHSYYWLQFDDNYQIDRLSLVVTKPALYKREAIVSTVVGQWIAIPAVRITIDPGDSVFQLPFLRAKRLCIEVANHDNAPMAIARVAAAQSGMYLLVYLEPEHQYQLVAGDHMVKGPEYDLHYFTDSLPAVPPTIGLGPLHRLDSAELSAVNEAYNKWRWNQRLNQRRNQRHSTAQLLLWGVLTAVILLLLYVSIKLVRAIDKKGKT